MLHPISLRDSTAYWGNLFSDEELDQILELCKTLPLEDGTIGEKKIEDEVRKSSVAWLKRNSDNEWIFARYDGAIHRTNSSFFCGICVILPNPTIRELSNNVKYLLLHNSMVQKIMKVEFCRLSRAVKFLTLSEKRD
jgi:hypothetical protein